MTSLQQFKQRDSARVSAKILSYFESFKKFVCCEELPQFQIQYTDSREDKNISYKAQLSPYQTPIILRYNIAELNERSNDFKYTLVHEFTHLYDYFIQRRNYDNNFIKRNLMLYTEYHAVEIEILFCYHIVDRLTENADFMKTDLRNMLKLPHQKNETYAASLINFYKKRTLQNFHTVKTAYMYSCGAISILNQLLDIKATPLDFIDPFKLQMKKVIELLSSVKYYNNPSGELLEQIGDINERITLFE